MPDLDWLDQTALLAGATLALMAWALSWADRCRPLMQSLAVLVACASGAVATACACRIISAWVLIRANGVTA